MEKIRKTVKSLVESDLMLKGAITAIGDNQRNKKVDFLVCI